MKLIGIDPDLHKSGVAIKENDILTMCECLTMWELFDFLRIQTSGEENYMVLLEFSFVTNTWHKGGKGAALNVGKNQAVAIIIKEFLETHSIKHELRKPAGYSLVFDDPETFKKTTGWQKQTNKDVRAAAAIVWAEKCSYKTIT